MTDERPEPVLEAHVPAVLDLNNEFARETSLMTDADLRALLKCSGYARQIGGGRDAVLIAIEAGTAYDSPNFAWFTARYADFVYIDRVVVAVNAQRRGLARALYADLFAWATAAGRPRIVGEINLDPPNPRSDAFHALLGFEEVGRAVLADRGKTVRYVARSLTG